MHCIEIKDLNVCYGSVCALENINLKIKTGEFLAIIGPNGGGKTTFLKSLIGSLKPTSGEVLIKGNMPIGYVSQFTFFDRAFPINVLDVVLIGRLKNKIKLFHRYSKKDVKYAESIMKSLGILNLKNRQISQLSGGQMQKVLIARALATNPKILILDEPTASLDSKTKKEIYEILYKLKGEKTVIIVTHEVENITSYIDSIAYINKELKHYGQSKNIDNSLIKKGYGDSLKLHLKQKAILKKIEKFRKDKKDENII